ncbi:MAG: hypothetical protein ACRET0_11465, partial [Steroidobacteraceae bacterium]
VYSSSAVASSHAGYPLFGTINGGPAGYTWYVFNTTALGGEQALQVDLSVAGYVGVSAQEWSGDISLFTLTASYSGTVTTPAVGPTDSPPSATAMPVIGLATGSRPLVTYPTGYTGTAQITTGSGNWAGLAMTANAAPDAPVNTTVTLSASSTFFWCNLWIDGASGGSIRGNAALRFANAGTLAGAGALAGNATLGFASAGTLGAAGRLAGAASLAFVNSATASSGAALHGNATLVLASAGTLRATGKLTGTEALAFASAGKLNATGALHGSATLGFANSGTAHGGIGVAGNATLAFASAATLAARGLLAGNASLGFANSGTAVSGVGLTGDAALRFASAGAIGATGGLHGNATLGFANAATLHATGMLSGEATLSLLSSGTLAAAVAIAGNATLEFTSRAMITNGYIVDPNGYLKLPAQYFYILDDPNMPGYFGEMDPGDTRVLTLDASAELVGNETLTGIAAANVLLLPGGTDPNPGHIISGTIINQAALAFGDITVPANRAVQTVAAGVLNGCTYLIAITAATSNPDKVLVLKGTLPVTSF